MFDRRSYLRPMSSGEIVDAALRVYQSMGWTFLKLTVLPALFCLAATMFISRFGFEALFLTKHAGDVKAQVGELFVSILVAFFVAAPLYMIGFSWGQAVVSQLTSDFLVGSIPSEQGAVRNAIRNLPRLASFNILQLTTAASVLLVGLLLLALSALLSTATPSGEAAGDAIAALSAGIGIFGAIVGWIVLPALLARYSLGPCAVLIEGRCGRAAMARSRTLHSRFGYQPSGTGTIWLLFLVMFFIWLLVGGGLSSILGMLNQESFLRNLVGTGTTGNLIVLSISLFPSFLAIWTILPLWSAGTTIAYYERRVRIEGFDIDNLATEVRRNSQQARFEL